MIEIRELLEAMSAAEHRGHYAEAEKLFERIVTDHEALTRRLAEAGSEIDRLRRDCGEAYQVVGCMSFDTENRRWTDEDEIRVLDNLSAAANGMPRPHDDLLPWPLPTPPKAASAAKGIEE